MKTALVEIDDDVEVAVDFKSKLITIRSGYSEVWLTEQQFLDIIGAVGSHSWAFEARIE